MIYVYTYYDGRWQLQYEHAEWSHVLPLLFYVQPFKVAPRVQGGVLVQCGKEAFLPATYNTAVCRHAVPLSQRCDYCERFGVVV